MKKAIVVAVLLLSVAGYSHAQVTTYMSGALASCPLTITEPVPIMAKGVDTGYTTFRSNTRNIAAKGSGAGFEFTFSDVTQEQLLSIDIYSTIDVEHVPTNVHLISCQNISVIATDSKPPSLTNSVRITATCDFNPNGVEAGSNGVAYLSLKGTTYKNARTDVAPYKAVYTGTLGGGYNSAGDNYTFTGSFGATTIWTQP